MRFRIDRVCGHRRYLCALLTTCLALLLAEFEVVYAQAKGQAVVDQSATGVRSARAEWVRQARGLRQTGRLLDVEAIKARLAEPVPEPVKLLRARRKRLDPDEVAAHAREVRVRLGYFYLCPNCDNWHINLAAGYPLTEEVVATCYHVVEPRSNIREGYLVAVDSRNRVVPVTAVLAAHEAMDAVLVKVEGARLTPVALNSEVRVGEGAFCFSDPLGQLDYFSQGIVNRFFWTSESEGGAALERASQLRLNVSTDWAFGSSGAAIMDERGNAIGHVSTISSLKPRSSTREEKHDKESGEGGDESVEKKRREQEGLLTVHTAVPAGSVRALVEAMNER